jgi:hypothetical protein
MDPQNLAVQLWQPLRVWKHWNHGRERITDSSQKIDFNNNNMVVPRR